MDRSPWWLCPVGGGVAWTRDGVDDGEGGTVQSPQRPLQPCPAGAPAGPLSGPTSLPTHLVLFCAEPVSPWRAGVTSGHCSPRGRKWGFDEWRSSGRKAVKCWCEVGCFDGPARGRFAPMLGRPPGQPSAQFLAAVHRGGGRSHRWNGSDSLGPTATLEEGGRC